MSKELARTKLVEIDGRQSGEIYYQLAWHVASGGLALIAKDLRGTRAIPVLPDKGNDAMAHPESGAYLGSNDVIYGVADGA